MNRPLRHYAAHTSARLAAFKSVLCTLFRNDLSWSQSCSSVFSTTLEQHIRHEATTYITHAVRLSAMSCSCSLRLTRLSLVVLLCLYISIPPVLSIQIISGDICPQLPDKVLCPCQIFREQASSSPVYSLCRCKLEAAACGASGGHLHHLTR